MNSRSFMDMTLKKLQCWSCNSCEQKELTLEDLPNLERMDAFVIAKPRKAFY